MAQVDKYHRIALRPEATAISRRCSAPCFDSWHYMDQMLICVEGDGASNTCHSDEEAAWECQRHSNGPRSQRWHSTTFRQRSHSTQGVRDLSKDYAYGLWLDHVRCASSESVVKSATQLEVLGRRSHGGPRQRKCTRYITS